MLFSVLVLKDLSIKLIWLLCIVSKKNKILSDRAVSSIIYDVIIMSL